LARKLYWRLIPGYAKKFEFVEKEAVQPEQESAFKDFLKHLAVQGGATEQEIDILRGLRFNGRHPTSLYYDRELQSLRDPLHFREGSVSTMHKRRDASDSDKVMQLDSRKEAIERWANNKMIPRKKTTILKT
jgi:hypothetical protein